MAEKSYKLTIQKSDGTSEDVSFTIPDTAGTYKLKFTLSNGEEIDAGNITVDTTAHSYDLRIQLSNNTEIDAGTIVTPVVEVTFANATWAQIAEISEAGEASSKFAVGDEKTITLTTGEEITLVILGFNHDDLVWQTTPEQAKAGMTIGMKNLLSTTYRMNASTATNAGGWDKSEMRKSTMATLLSQLPSDLQGVIKQVRKKAAAGSQSESITTSADKLWLLAMSEIFSATSIENTTTADIKNHADTYNAEGTQYEYYENLIGDNNGGTANNSLLIKKLSNGSGSANPWWLRSPYASNSTHFRYINAVGSVLIGYSNSAYGVSFAFCV